MTEPGDITTSNHLPIIFKLSAKPFIVEKPPIYDIRKANWDIFKETVDEEITKKNLNQSNTDSLEQEINKRTRSINKAMNIAIIPKSNLKRISNWKSQMKYEI